MKQANEDGIKVEAVQFFDTVLVKVTRKNKVIYLETIRLDSQLCGPCLDDKVEEYNNVNH